MTAGTVHFRLMPPEALPFGPVNVYFGRRGITWVVDRNQIDPVLGDGLARVGDQLMSMIPRLNLDTPVVQVHRSHALGGDRVVVAHLTHCLLDVFVPHELITAQAATHLSKHGTVVLRELMQMAARLNQRPPAA